MNSFKIGSLLLSMLLMASSIGASKPQQLRFQVKQDSQVSIHGKSNVHAFSCCAMQAAQASTISLRQQTQTLISIQGSVDVNLKAFDCKNKIMNRDFQKTLKADSFKQMTITLLSFDRMPILDGRRQTLMSSISIEVAGKRKNFKVPLTFIPKGKGNYQLQGEQDFLFADFDLTPPRAAGGLIRVKPKVRTTFTLNLTHLA